MSVRTKAPPLDWRFLKTRIVRVKVDSCADGTFRIKPVWQKKWQFGETKTPGLFTRMSCAKDLEQLLNARLKATARNKATGNSGLSVIPNANAHW